MSAQLLFALPISAPTTPSVAVAGGDAQSDPGGFGALVAAQADTPGTETGTGTETGADPQQAPAQPARPDHRGSRPLTTVTAASSRHPEASAMDEQVAAQEAGETGALAIPAPTEDDASPATGEANADPVPHSRPGVEDDLGAGIDTGALASPAPQVPAATVDIATLATSGAGEGLASSPAPLPMDETASEAGDETGALSSPASTPGAQVPAAPRLISNASDGVDAATRPEAGASLAVETPPAQAPVGAASAPAPMVGDSDRADVAEAAPATQVASTSVSAPLSTSIKEEAEPRAAPRPTTPPILSGAMTTADQGLNSATSVPAAAPQSSIPQAAPTVAGPGVATPAPEASASIPLTAEAALDGTAAQVADARPAAALSRHAPPPPLTSPVIEAFARPAPAACQSPAAETPAAAPDQPSSRREAPSEASLLTGDRDASTAETDAPRAAATPSSASQGIAAPSAAPSPARTPAQPSAAIAAAPLTSPAPAEPQPGLEPPLAASSPDQAMGEASPAPASRTAIEATAQVAAQIQRRLDGRSTRFEMVLTPESLGRVDVSLDIDSEGRLAARLAFDNPAAALDMKGRVDDLRRQLEAAGFQLADDALDFTQRDPAFGQGFDRRHDGARAFARGRQVEQEAEAVPVAPAAWVSHSLTPRGVDLKV